MVPSTGLLFFMSPRGKRAFIPGFIDWFNKYLNADDVAGTEMLWGFRVNRQKFLPLWSFCLGRGDKMSGIPSRSHRSTHTLLWSAELSQQFSVPSHFILGRDPISSELLQLACSPCTVPVCKDDTGWSQWVHSGPQERTRAPQGRSTTTGRREGML